MDITERRIFLSHISDEASEARALKQVLERGLPGSHVFVSAADIHFGKQWLKEIEQALTGARAILTLCSPNSIRRPWLNFESGSGWARSIPVLTLCHKGLRENRVPDPLGIFQGLDLTDADSCRQLVKRLGAILETDAAEHFDPIEIVRAIQVELPTRTSEIGIVVCHGQGKWPNGERSVFNFLQSKPNYYEDDWTFRDINDERKFLSANLDRLSGLIFATPRKARIEPETIAATVEWVRKGGRLLLLGFELGDRHHEANMAELSHHFGIDPGSDIVGPAGYQKKPYEVPIEFDVSAGEPHIFTEGLDSVQLANVQSVRVEPGGIEWLRVGSNSMYKPRQDTVVYWDGVMTTPGGADFEENQHARWLPVAVQAPQGLCGKGSVHMIGTWDLLGRSQAFGGHNVTLVKRLLNWLSGKTP
jgi:hypothetical protein